MTTITRLTDVLKKAETAVFEEKSAKARVIWLSAEAIRLAREAAEKVGNDPELAEQEVLDRLGVGVCQLLLPRKEARS